MEQMLLTSGFNVQSDGVMKLLKPIDIPMKNLPTPPEVECLGIGLTDLNVHFKKGYVELTTGYKKVDKPRDPKLCDKFIDTLTKGPRQAKDSVNSLFGGKSAKEFLDEKASMFEEQYDKIKAANVSGSGKEEAAEEEDPAKDPVIEEEL